MSTWPSVISTISNPAATNKLNSPSHSSIESAQNDAVSKLETFIGTLSSAVGTLVYDIRAVASPGGGHVQATNVGGTGQTGFTKGDILVAQSSSVLSKLAVGTDNQVLLSNSLQPTGVSWGSVASGAVTAANIQNQTYIYARASVISASVYGVVLSQAVSILSDGLGLVVKFPASNTSSVVALQVNATGPSSLTALIKNTAISNLSIGDIQPSMIGVLEFDSVSSVFQILDNVGMGTWKVLLTSWDISTTTNVTVAHGLGRIPKFVKVYATYDDGAYQSHSEGGYDGTNNYVTVGAVKYSSVAGGGTGQDTSYAIYAGNAVAGGSNSARASIGVDITNITFTRVKGGTPTGTVYVTIFVQ